MKKQNKNIIFFAGTAMHKEIKTDPMEEKIYNTLLIYSVQKGGEVQISTWNKVNYSSIDGFSINGCVVREKIPCEEKNEVIGIGVKALKEPSINYAGLMFSFDICLDYNYNDGYSYSKKLLTNRRADFNILVAGGMPIMDHKYSYDPIEKKSADHIIRCDKFSAKDQGCCSVRYKETYSEMEAMKDTAIRYADFNVEIEGPNKEIKQIN